MGVHGFHVTPWGEPFPAVSCEHRRGVPTMHPQLLGGRARDSPAGGLLFLLAFFFFPSRSVSGRRATALLHPEGSRSASSG